MDFPSIMKGPGTASCLPLRRAPKLWRSTHKKKKKASPHSPYRYSTRDAATREGGESVRALVVEWELFYNEWIMCSLPFPSNPAVCGCKWQRKTLFHPSIKRWRVCVSVWRPVYGGRPLRIRSCVRHTHTHSPSIWAFCRCQVEPSLAFTRQRTKEKWRKNPKHAKPKIVQTIIIFQRFNPTGPRSALVDDCTFIFFRFCTVMLTVTGGGRMVLFFLLPFASPYRCCQPCGMASHFWLIQITDKFLNW